MAEDLVVGGTTHEGVEAVEFKNTAGEKVTYTVGGTEIVQTTAIDFSAWSDGSFKETLADGTEITYMVEFDESGQPTKISDGTTECAVTWEA